MNRQSKGISLKKINVTDRFLKREMELARTEVIPYQWEALNDNVEGAEPSFCMRNFKLAAKLGKKRRALGQESLPVWTTEEFNLVPEKGKPMEDRFYGFVFQDTDFSKWIEAVGIRNLKNWRTTRSTLCVRHSTRMGILTPFILSMIRPSALPTCVTTTNCIVLGI